jgi:glycosyltransferase involved in cell wall biosynthesis
MEIRVAILLTGANEGSTPLEAASEIDDEDIDVTVIDFFEASSSTFGVDVCSMEARSKFDYQGYIRLFKSIRSIQPDILHIHPNAIGSIIRIMKPLLDIPCIVTTEHSTHEEYGFLRNLINGGTNWLNEIVVANSSSTAESFRRWEKSLLKLSNTEVEIIHYGANLDAIDTVVQERLGPPLPDGFLIATAGRLAKEKNIVALIYAMQELSETYSNIQLIIVGDGPERTSLEMLTNNLHIENNITFFGWVPRADVYAILNRADVFVFPSHYEGFGVANVEAMAVGTPVIVNDLPVLREVVGDAGIFVNANYPSALASEIERLYTDDKFRKALGKRAKSRARNKFPLKKTVKEYNNLYRNCMKDQHADD